MFPPIEPFATGMLTVGDGNRMYWEASGNPDGKPALTLHGGPGSGLGAGYRKRFDPEQFLIVGLDQRGCGRSQPLVTEPDADLATNTTQALIADIEALREHLGIAQWMVTGLSWGTTLALAYAQAYPDRVSELVLFAVTNTTPAEVEWVTETMGNLFPEEWQELVEAVDRRPDQRVIDAAYAKVTDPDPDTRAAGIRAWCRWEDTHISLDPNRGPMLGDDDPEIQAIFATLVTHYWSNGAFLGTTEVLDGMGKIAHIPGVMIHGRLDVSSPLVTSWRLHRAWPGSEWIVVDGEGHGGPVMIEEMVKAIARFATG